MDARKYDIVLFGATGFTGALTAHYLARHAGSLRWALAGRNRAKLTSLQTELATSGPRPELVIADVDDAASLRTMAGDARVVITTVGPYLKYGLPLVAACAEHGTHYVDLTGEPPFAEQTRARYHDIAVRHQAKIVHACGFDSLPHDLGARFTLHALRQRMSEAERASTPVTIEAFVRTKGSISGGTWHSTLLILSQLERGGSSQPSAANGRTVAAIPHRIAFRKEVGLWQLPMPSIDPIVVLESARALLEYGPEFHYGHYLGLKRLPQVAGMVVGAGALMGLSRLRVTRELLEKLRPSGAGPSEAERAQSFFRVLFLGRAGAHKVRCQVRGGDPGYGETSKMLAESALCLVQDRERLPQQYGVITSAVAFGDVLTERLQRAGIVFEQLADGV